MLLNKKKNTFSLVPWIFFFHDVIDIFGDGEGGGGMSAGMNWSLKKMIPSSESLGSAFPARRGTKRLFQMSGRLLQHT